MDERKKQMSLFLTYLSPLPAAGGSWVAGQQTHGFPHFSSFSIVTFLWPLRKKNTSEHYSKMVTSKYFRKILTQSLNVKKKKSAINFSDIFVSLIFSWNSYLPPNSHLIIPQGLAGNIYAFCHSLKAYLFFFHPCLLNLDLLILCRGTPQFLSVCPAVVVLSVYFLKDVVWNVTAWCGFGL